MQRCDWKGKSYSKKNVRGCAEEGIKGRKKRMKERGEIAQPALVEAIVVTVAFGNIVVVIFPIVAVAVVGLRVVSILLLI